MLCCDGYPPRKSFFFPFFSLYIYFCFHYNENRRPRRPAKYFARSQKLTPYPFSFFFYPSSFDFALKRKRNRIELESEEREKKMFSLLSTGTELLYVESLGCIFACIVSVSQQNVFGIHTRGGSWLTLTWLETSFWVGIRYAISHWVLPSRSQFSHCPLGRMKKPHCGSVVCNCASKDRPLFEGQQPQAALL